MLTMCSKEGLRAHLLEPVVRALMIGSVVAGSMMGLPGVRLAVAQQPWDRQAVYAAREAQLKAAIESRPADPQPLVDLAAFYLRPVAPRDVEAADGVRRQVMVPLRNEWIVEGIKEIYAVPWVFRGDPDLARPLLKRALQMDPQLESDPVKKSQWNLATAVYHHWLGELEKSAGSANAALRADPTSLDALDFLVDITRGTHTKDRLATYKAILDRWAGADTTPVALKPRTMGPRR